MKDTLPENSVIAANWSSGNRINVLGGVKTIIDPDHYLPHWIHLYYRHVFCAQSEQEALEFLKTHGATHLILSEHGILSNAGSYSFIGSNEKSDRMFRIYPLEKTETSIGSPYRFVSQKNRAKETFSVLDFFRISPEKLKVSAQITNRANIVKDITLSPADMMQTSLDFEDIGAILYFGPRVRLQKAYSVPAPGWNSLAVKLYFRGEHSDAFVPVYPVESNTPPKIKIWEIHYPPDIQTNPQYLKTGVPEIDKDLEIQ